MSPRIAAFMEKKKWPSERMKGVRSHKIQKGKVLGTRQNIIIKVILNACHSPVPVLGHAGHTRGLVSSSQPRRSPGVVATVSQSGGDQAEPAAARSSPNPSRRDLCSFFKIYIYIFFN